MHSSEIATDHLIKSLEVATETAIPTAQPKNKKAPWNPIIKELLNEGQMINKTWKLAGKPMVPHKLFTARKDMKSKFRQEQRKENARKREQLYLDISIASSNDKQMFFRLIKKQRSSISTATKELILDSTTYTEDLPHIWCIHFSRLATPLQMERFNQSYAERVNKDVAAIEADSRAHLNPLDIPISPH